MLSVIKNIFSKNKKKKLLIFLSLILVVFFLIFKYLENNIQQIISNEFSKKNNYSLSLDDVDFKFSGNISFDNVVILNKEKDTVFYSPKIVVNSKSLQKVIINDELNFNNILIKDGFFKYENFDDFKTLKTNSNFNDNLNIKNLKLDDFKISFMDYTSIVDFEIADLSLIDNKISLKIKDSELDLKDNKNFKKINANVNIHDNNIKLNDLSIALDNSFFEGNLFVKNFNDLELLKFDGDITNKSKITSSDFIEGSAENSFNFNVKFEGDFNQIFLNEFELKNNNTNILAALQIKNPFDKSKYDLTVDFTEFSSVSTEISNTFPEIFGSYIPSSLKSIGKFKLIGSFIYSNEKIVSDFELFNNKGNIYSSLIISEFDNIDNASYAGVFKGDKIDLSNFISIPFLGKSNFEFTIDGKGFVPQFLDSNLEGKVKTIIVNGYEYQNIDVFGNVSDKVFNGKINVNDQNINLDFTGLIDYSDELIDFDFSTNIVNANLGKLNLAVDDNFLSGKINTKLRGNSISTLIGDISFKDFVYGSKDNKYFFDELVAQSRINNDIRFYNLNSPDALSGIIIGDLDFFELPKILENYFLLRYNNFNPTDKLFLTDLSFNLNLKPKIASVLNSDIIIDENTFIRGDFNLDGAYELVFSTPHFKSKDLTVNNINLKINDNAVNASFAEFQSKLINGTKIKVNSKFLDDKTDFYINFNSASGDNKINFNHSLDKNQRSVFSFLDLSFDYNNNKWVLLESLKKDDNVLILSDEYQELKSTKIKSEDQVIEFKYLNNKDEFDFDSIFQNVRFSSIIPKPKNILYEGIVNGNISLSKRSEVYLSNSEILLKNFSSNGQILGDGLLNIQNSDSKDKYNVEFTIINQKLKTFNVSGFFKISDNDYPLALNVETNKFLISPFSAIGENVLQNFKGHFDSNFTVTGSFYKPNFKGHIKANNSSFDVPYLGVRYSFPENPSFILDKMSIYMDNFKIQDTQMNSFGILDGKINHDRLKDWFLDFQISSENLLAINTNKEQNDFYYGQGMFDGYAKFYGPGKDLDININGSSNDNTKITIPIKYDDGVGSLSYLKFSSDINTNSNLINQGLEVFIDLKLNNKAELEIIFDENSGSKLSGRGEGDFRFESDYSGNFNIKGDFTTEIGKYHYKNFGIVERIFDIKKGANISWDGDPYKGIINAEAIYEVPGGANPAPIIQNASFNRKIPTLVNILLSGELSNLQTPKFEILFPNTRGSIKSELDYYLNDYEKKQTQAISLISQGFFTESGNNSLVSSQTITNNLFQRASGIIDEIFTNPEDKMNVGINYSQGDRFSSSSLLNRDRIGLSLQSEISDRILINGKIGVPVSGTEENIILGDVQIEFLLNDSGSLKARIFNKENEYQFFGDEIGYTQGFGISYDVEFDTFSELISKIRKKNKEK